MAKFKVGDKVRVTNISPRREWKQPFIGLEGTVLNIFNCAKPNTHCYHVSGFDYLFHDDELELVKPKFDHTKYFHGRYVIHTKTLEEAKLFEKYMRHNGGRPASSNNWDVYMEDTCFNINTCSYMNIDWYKTAGYTILEFEDFDWSDFEMKKEFTKKDLKNGDVIKRRCGDVEIVCVETGTCIINGSGWNSLHNLNDDLTWVHKNPDYDVVAVRRPTCPKECTFSAFDSGYGELVYERKEVEEMTLAEVCKALGKEIKIIKER